MKPKKMLYMGLLITLTGTTCSGQSTRPSTTDSLRKLLPKGFVVLTEDGAKEALKAKVDANIYRLQLGIKDSVIIEKDVIISAKNEEIRQRIFINADTEKALKKANRQLVFKTIEVWTLRAALLLKIVRVW